ncbi:carbohydrate ABC transporter permease [Paenibacillus cremeus]|nr:carbohydrate ABC transporter permease [Paenibacillus cremeus]
MSLWPGKVTLDNYINGWSGFSGASFAIFFRNSLLIAMVAIIGNVFSCSLTAYPFARMDFPLKKLLFGMMLMTIMIPEHVLLIPQYIMFNTFGWVNTYLPLLVPRFFAVNSFFIYLMIQFVRSLPKELDQAATVDGCSRLQIYWKLILPLSMPVLVTAMIFTFISTWNDFLHPLIYISEVKHFTVSLGLSLFITSGEGKSEYSQLFAMSMLSLIPLLTVFVFFQRYIVDGIATSGIK